MISTVTIRSSYKRFSLTYRFLFPGIFLLLLCTIGCEEQEAERISSDTASSTSSEQAGSESWIRPSSYYDTLSPNPTPLSGGKSSPEELIHAGLQALEAGDTAMLVQLLVTPEEYSSIIYPELGKHWGGARDTRETITSWLKQNHFGSAEKGLRRALRDYEGYPFTFKKLTFGDSIQDYPSYQLYQEPQVLVTDKAGKEHELRIFGSIIEKEGLCKFLSFRDTD